MRSVCVYCGSSFGADPAYLDATRELAQALAARSLRVVYGGASVWLMGALSDATLAAGGAVAGVIPQPLVDREIAHPGLTELHVVRSMHERKALMAELSDAFVALPGGIGTLEELIEMWTWAQLGLHSKPLAVLNTLGYYDGLATFLDHAVEQGFLVARSRDALTVAPDAQALLAAWRLSANADVKSRSRQRLDASRARGLP